MAWLIIGIVAAIVLFIVFIYNNLVTLRNRVDNAWSQVDVPLRRRTDLIPNLMESVKVYMKHERGTLEAITNARASMMKAGSVGEKALADNMLSHALKSLFAVAENYPDLK